MPELAPRHPLTVIAASAIALIFGLSLSGCTAIGEFVLERIGEVGQDDEPTEDVYDNGDTSLLDIEVGQCIDDEALFGEESIASLNLGDCAKPHTAELYSTWNLPDGPFPGYYEVDEAVLAGCEERFADYVGAPSAETDLDFYYFAPIEEFWSTDREAICFAIDYDQQPLTESVKGRGASEPVPSEG